MRLSRPLAGAAIFTGALLAACNDSSGVNNNFVSAPPITTSPDLTGVVSDTMYEFGNSPGGGGIDQHDAFLVVSPGTRPNAGIVLGRDTPVFRVDAAGTYTQMERSMVRPGYEVQAWVDQGAGWGAVEAPLGAMVLIAKQVVITRWVGKTVWPPVDSTIARAAYHGNWTRLDVTLPDGAGTYSTPFSVDSDGIFVLALDQTYSIFGNMSITGELSGVIPSLDRPQGFVFFGTCDLTACTGAMSGGTISATR